MLKALVNQILWRAFLWISLLFCLTTYSLTFYFPITNNDYYLNRLDNGRHNNNIKYVSQEVHENLNITRKILGASLNATVDLDRILREDVTKMSPTDIVKSISEIYRTLTHKCSKTAILGGMYVCSNGRRSDAFDGYKTVCFDEKVRPVPRTCTILSFGIFNDFTFDNAAAKYGCKIFSFDFSITYMKNSYYGRNSHFLNMALSDINDQNVVLNLAPYRTKQTPNGHLTSRLTLYSILDVLDLRVSKIDYLKIDVDHNEWSIFSQIFRNDSNILNNVQQIIVETHLERIRYLSQDYSHISEMYDAYQLYRQLNAFGFKLANWIPNLYTDSTFTFNDITFPIYQELHFIRIKQKFG